MKIKLLLTPKQTAVICAFLDHTRLGYDNDYTLEISQLVISMQEDRVEDYLNAMLGSERPKISVEYNENEGLVFNIAGEEDGNPAGS
jgi:hypothetical protein